MPARGDDQHDQRENRRRHATQNPELLPRQHTVDQRGDGKLSSRTAKHAEALGKTDGCRKIASRKSMGGQIDRAGEGKS